MIIKKVTFIIIIEILVLMIGGCTSLKVDNAENNNMNVSVKSTENEETITTIEDFSSTDLPFENSIFNRTEMFTDRDLEQNPSLDEAITLKLESEQEIVIDEEGIYVINGEVKNSTIKIDANDDAKVQLVLDGVNIINENLPPIYVKSADKVFITTTESENYMEVSGDYLNDTDTNFNAVIFSKSDLVLNGVGNLKIVSAKGNGITSKDDLKITGGVISVNSYADSLEANDSIRIYDGEINIVTNKDGFHSENNEDSSLGYIYIQNGVLNISAVDDAITGNSFVIIDDGIINIETSSEGIEAHYIQINGGNINIYAKDDGINATSKSNYDGIIEVNDGNINIIMGNGDTDAFDSNGDLYIKGGNINIEGQSAFDADGVAELIDGNVIVNGKVLTKINN
ncbi:carbohydrate-binding domain-containing protein [Defluviitalea phaphyphila]|uniref:carbohydrate-binding domain-containing protein n=1 Tax=Defluviitalea phaphyphila TaxID=1473580 RepID=UPI00072FC109|nr:carbohydrate-binding domain-containing protein [Defluviitalea phaphyphila]